MGTLAPEWSPPERFLLPIHTAAAPLPTRGGARLVVTLVDWDRFFPDVDLARAVVKLANLPPVALSDRDARGRAEAAAAAAAYGGDGTTDASSAPTRGGGDAGELLERTTGVETDASTQATTTTKAPSPPRDGVAREVRRLVVPLLDVETNEPVRAVGCNAPLALELRLGVRAAAEARRHRADAVFAYEVRSRRRGTSGVAPSTTTTQKVIVMYRTSASRHARSSGRPRTSRAPSSNRASSTSTTRLSGRCARSRLISSCRCRRSRAGSASRGARVAGRPHPVVSLTVTAREIDTAAVGGTAAAAEAARLVTSFRDGGGQCAIEHICSPCRVPRARGHMPIMDRDACPRDASERLGSVTCRSSLRTHDGTP